MQLLRVHLILIGSAIALAALFGLRALLLLSRGGGSSYVALFAVSVVVAAALVAYFRKVRARWVEARRTARR